MNKNPLSLLILPALALVTGCSPQKKTSQARENRAERRAKGDTLLAGLLGRYPQYFDTLLKRNDQWQIRIIYTQIDRKANNMPVFTDHVYNLSNRDYFYPASTVKMPTAILALQRLRELKIPGLDRNTTMVTEAGYPGQTAVFNDPTAEDGRPTISQYIRRIFLVSDNEAFNRLYEFLGQEYINNTLHRMGYDSVQILHRLNISLTEDENRHTNPVKFYDQDARILYEQPLVNSRLVYQPRSTFLGKGYYRGDQLVMEPFDFSQKNRFTLRDLHSLLRSVIFPRSVRRKKRFHLEEEDYQFLYRYMSMKPRESDYPPYDTSFTDAYSKLLLYGGRGEMGPDIRIFNKEGDAYGFLTDVAYVADFRNRVEFFLSASIYCNSDGIFNDDQYDYDRVGYPFLKNLGQVIYQFELQRKKEHLPDLSRFKMNYGR